MIKRNTSPRDNDNSRPKTWGLVWTQGRKNRKRYFTLMNFNIPGRINSYVLEKNVNRAKKITSRAKWNWIMHVLIVLLARNENIMKRYQNSSTAPIQWRGNCDFGILKRGWNHNTKITIQRGLDSALLSGVIHFLIFRADNANYVEVHGTKELKFEIFHEFLMNCPFQSCWNLLKIPNH